VVVANDERVVLEGDLTATNHDGWTPLHACCHSAAATSAGLTVIDAMRRQGCSFEQRTRRGPGSGNKVTMITTIGDDG